MKKLVFLLSFFFFTSSFAQVKVLKPTEIIPIPEIDLFKCEQLFLTDDVRYEDMSPEDKALVDLGERNRVLEHFYSAVTSSSALSAKYAGENAHDFSILNAWAEGVPGGGVGEYLLYTFPGKSAPVTIVEILNGYTKTKKAWKNNGRVKRLKMYYNGKPYAILELKDTRSLQSFNVGRLGPFEAAAPDWTLKFEILDVYPGDKYDDTVITELYFGGISPH